MQSNEQLARNRYNAIDLCKFIFSIMIVMIHFPPFGLNSKYAGINYVIQNCLCRIAVPFFFVASGFLLYRKCEQEKYEMRYSKDYILKFLRLYVVWTVIYFPLCLKGIIGNEVSIFRGGVLYIRDLLFVGSYRHLWYLNASIVGVAIVSFLLYKGWKIRHIIIPAFVLYTIGLFTQSWYGIIKPLSVYAPHIWSLMVWYQKVFVTTRNGLFEGFLFISVGMFFAFSKKEIGTRKAICGFSISFLLMVLEFVFVTRYNIIKHYDMYFFLVPTSFFLFCIIKSVKLKDNKIYAVLRQMSSLMFYMHLWVAEATSKILLKLFGINIYGTGLCFALTLCLSVCLSFIIIELSKYSPFRWLKIIYA